MSEISKQALKVDNTESFPNNSTGYITPSLLREYNENVIDSTVNQTVYTADSSSWNSKISQLNAFTASQQPSFTALNAFTASQLTVNSGVNSFTQSTSGRLAALESETANLEAFTSSINQIIVNGASIGTSTRLFFNGYVSASIVPNVDGPIASITILADQSFTPTASFNAYTASTAASQSVYSASVSTQIVALQNFSTSLDTTFATDAQLNASSSTLQSNIDTKLNTSSFNAYTQSVTTFGYATTGSNTFVGKQIITGSQNGIVIDGFASFIDLSGFNSHISMYSGTGSIRFYTGSAQGDGTSNIDTWVNMQVNPANGALAISSFPSNNHFVDFDVAQTASVFTAPIQGMTGTLRINGSTTITGLAGNNGNVNINVAKNAQLSGSQYNIMTQWVDTTTDPSNVYSGYELKGDDAFQLNYASLAVSSYTSEYPSTPTGIMIGGGFTDGTQTLFGFPVNQGIDAWKRLSAKKGLNVTGSLNVSGSLTYTGSTYGNVISASISSLTASLDFSKANFYTLTLSGSSNTFINIQNVSPGQTAMVEITNAGLAATASFSSNVFQPNASYYVPTNATSSVDILTFSSFNASKVYLVSVKNMTNN